MDTKTLNRLILLLSLIYLMHSCDTQNSTKTEYYSNGIIKIKEQKLNDSCVHKTTYTETGSLLFKGKYCNQKKEGLCEEYYADGAIKWKGLYKKGERIYSDIISFEDKPIELFIKDNPDTLIAQTTYLIRIKIPEIHPDDIELRCLNGFPTKKTNLDEYDFTLMPMQSGKVELQLKIKQFETSGIIAVLEIPVK